LAGLVNSNLDLWKLDFRSQNSTLMKLMASTMLAVVINRALLGMGLESRTEGRFCGLQDHHM